MAALMLALFCGLIIDVRQRHWQIKPVAFNNIWWIILHPTSIHKRHKCPNYVYLASVESASVVLWVVASISFQNGWLFRMSNRRKPRHKLGKGNGAIPEKRKNMEGWQWLWVNWVNLWNQGTTDQGVIPNVIPNVIPSSKPSLLGNLILSHTHNLGSPWLMDRIG